MTVSKVVSNVSDPEGPVSIGPSTWVITEMGTGAITRIGPAPGDRTTLATTGRPNGLVVDADGVLWIAESRHRSLMRLDPRLGEATVVTGSASGEALMWPNDLCIGPDGLVYLTDSGVDPDSFQGSSASERANMRLDGRVVVIDPTTREGRILDRGLQFANGIAIGPDGTSLHVAETLTGRIYRYPLADISSKTREVFGQVLRETPSSYDGVAGPDGMAFDSNGVLLVAVLAQGTLTTLSPDGGVLDHLALGDSFPTNVAFGGPEHKSVLVTGCATGTLLGLEWTVPGLRLHEELKGQSQCRSVLGPV